MVQTTVKIGLNQRFSLLSATGVTARRPQVIELCAAERGRDWRLATGRIDVSA
jgi:hypothetical protein